MIIAGPEPSCDHHTVQEGHMKLSRKALAISSAAAAIAACLGACSSTTSDSVGSADSGSARLGLVFIDRTQSQTPTKYWQAMAGINGNPAGFTSHFKPDWSPPSGDFGYGTTTWVGDPNMGFSVYNSYDVPILASTVLLNGDGGIDHAILHTLGDGDNISASCSYTNPTSASTTLVVTFNDGGTTTDC